MTHLNFPPAIAQAIAAFSPVSRAWALAAGLELDDVRQEIAIAILVGEDPARAVPRVLRIRRVGTDWRSLDAAPAAMQLEIGERERAADEVAQADDLSGIAEALYGGTALVAERCGVGRAAAQKRLRAQLRRFEAAGDLFATGGE